MEELTYIQKLIIEIARLKFGYRCSEMDLIREVSRTTRMTRKQAAEDVHFLLEGGYLKPVDNTDIKRSSEKDYYRFQNLTKLFDLAEDNEK